MSLGRLSRCVHSVLCVSLLQPDCLRHIAPEGEPCLNPVPLGLVQPGRGVCCGSGSAFRGQELKEFVCLLCMDGSLK